MHHDVQSEMCITEVHKPFLQLIACYKIQNKKIIFIKMKLTLCPVLLHKHTPCRCLKSLHCMHCVWYLSLSDLETIVLDIGKTVTVVVAMGIVVILAHGLCNYVQAP